MKLALHTILILDERVTKSFWDTTAFFLAMESIYDRGFSKCKNSFFQSYSDVLNRSPIIQILIFHLHWWLCESHAY